MPYFCLNMAAPWTDEFSYLRFSNRDDELVICNPPGSICESPVYLKSKKTIDEHIQLVNEKQIKKAMVVGEDIGFLQQCPSLEELSINPSFDSYNFDFSPLYDLPNLKKLCCHTMYGQKEDRISHVDYSKFRSLEELTVCEPKGHHNIHMLKGLRVLYLSGKQPVSKTLVGAFDGEKLEELSLVTSSVRNLNGLAQAPQLKKLELSYNRSLEDITDIVSVKDTLTHLEIDSCGKVKDFSVLGQLRNLQWLKLRGNNALPNLAFLNDLPNLQTFILRMNVVDGDLSMCLRIPSVSIIDRRHFSHKDADLPKIKMK